MRSPKHVDALAYRGKGKKRRLVRVLQVTEDGAVAQYEPIDEPGHIYMPLIGPDGKNVEQFEICRSPEQALVRSNLPGICDATMGENAYAIR